MEMNGRCSKDRPKQIRLWGDWQVCWRGSACEVETALKSFPGVIDGEYLTGCNYLRRLYHARTSFKNLQGCVITISSTERDRELLGGMIAVMGTSSSFWVHWGPDVPYGGALNFLKLFHHVVGRL